MKELLWAAYLKAHFTLVCAIDQQGSTPADDAQCVAGVKKTIAAARANVASVEALCGEHLAGFARKYAKGDF